MKRIYFLLFLLVPFVYVNAQIKVDVKGKITREADRRANKRTDKAINKVFDKVDEEIDSAVKKDNKEEKAESKDAQKVENKEESQKLPSAGVDSSSKANLQTVLSWAKYDFVPGEKIFFEDNQENEQNGEFPSLWDLASDGDDAYNMTLSENRAKAVVSQFVSMGIQASRLSSKGWGESKPVDNNGTPEGKANNRRVEFIKL
ncbi:MAG TPA: OmpA family protein [Bacteroidales bacterium]|mgnify:CR=1 FL=1|nr:OmpA family protein [Bacteroidales bacterium]HQG36751.1 OmpA family protein [Bacteroidales bacterium]HQG53239.1 OmpA family protein [Bacteroidales bacterium]HQJ21341.1 OmpA family protein [Bacteroidales bacterium]